MSEEGKEEIIGFPAPNTPSSQGPLQDVVQPPQSPTDPAVKKKKRNKIILISVLSGVGAILIAAVLVLVLVILPELDRSNRYTAAMQAYQGGSYPVAAEAFAKLPAYKESGKYLELAKVYVLKGDAKYDEAKAEFTRLGLPDEATECDYLKAAGLLKDGKTKEAYDLFTALGKYKDSANQVTAISDTESSKLVAQITAVKAPANAADFPAAIKSMNDLKDDANQYGVIGPVAGAINKKMDEIRPVYAQAYFDQVLLGKTTKDTKYITDFGVKSGKNFNKKLITQRFDTSPDIMCFYFKITKDMKNKTLTMSTCSVGYNDTTMSYDYESSPILHGNDIVMKSGNYKEIIEYWTLKGTDKAGAYDDRLPPGIYHFTVSLTDSKEVLGSIYFTIGMK